MATAAELVVMFTSDTKGLDDGLKSSESRLGGLASKLGGFGTMAAAGLAAGGVAAVGLGAVAVAAASDIAESQNKVNVVFGESAGAINDLAATAASKLGQTKAEVLNAAGGIGNLLTAMGQSKEGAADMSIGMVKLAADLGSFNNASSAEVLEAMTAAMAGETDGMKKYGVAINDNTLKQAALDAGLSTNIASLSTAEKQGLAYKIMMDQTATAQGDFANTSTGMANSLKIIKAQFTDVVGQIGGALLPIVEKVIGWFGERLPGAIETAKGFLGSIDFAGMFAGAQEALGSIDFAGIFGTIKESIAGIDWKGIGETVMSLVGHFKDGLAVVLPIVAGIFQNVLMPIISAVFGFFKEHTGILTIVGGLLLALTGPIGAVVVALTVLGALGPKFGEFVSMIGGGLVAGIGGFISGVTEAVLGLGGAVIDAFKSFFGISSPSTVFMDFGINLLQGLIDGLVSMFGAVVATLVTVGTAMLAEISTRWEAIKTTIMDALEVVRVYISAKWDAIKEYLTGKLREIGDSIKSAWDAVKTTITDAMDAVGAAISDAWEEYKENFNRGLDAVKGFITNAWESYKENFRAGLDYVKGVITTAWENYKENFRAGLDYVKEIIRTKWEEFKENFRVGLDAVKAIVAAKWVELKERFNLDEILEKIRTFVSRFTTIGSDLIEGLKSGISKGWDTLKTWLSGLFGDLITLAKKILGIASPSKVMAKEVGEPIGQGIIEGMRGALIGTPIISVITEWANKASGFTFGPSMSKGLGRALAPAFGMAVALGFQQFTKGPLGLPFGDSAVFDNRVGSDPRMGGGGRAVGSEVFEGKADQDDDGRVNASGMRGGKGGLLAASKSNYWRVFVNKWGVPEEGSARKTAAYLSIPLPDWLEAIYNPPQGETVGAPGAMSEPEAAAIFDPLRAVIGDTVGALGELGKSIIALKDLMPTRPGEGFTPIGPIGGGGGGIGIPIPGPGNPGTMQLAAQAVQVTGQVLFPSVRAEVTVNTRPVVVIGGREIEAIATIIEKKMAERARMEVI